MKRYHYTLAEQETIINWDNELDEATVYTFDRRLISKLKALAAKYPEHYVLLDKGAQRSVTYRVPKRCIGIRPPYSDMRRKQQAEDAKTNHYVTLGTDARGNLTRIDNVLGGIEGRIETTKQKLDSLYQQQEDAKVELGKPFPQEAELQQKSARLAELDAALNMDEHETVGVIGEDDPDIEVGGVSMVAEKSSVIEYLKNPPECVSSGRQRKHEEEVL